MYRVLHIMAGADAGGISTVVLNYYRLVNKEKIHFDLALTTNMIGINALEMKKLGAQIYRLPLKSLGIKAFEEDLMKLLKSQNYQAVHVHENETSYVALRVAKKAGIPQRIAHAHTSSPFVSIKGELRRLSGCILNYHYATNVIACGILAGNRVFGKVNMQRSKAYVLPNAIDSEKFRFDSQIRKSVREELEVQDCFVIGMVGRISRQKNYDKALEIMKKYSTINDKAILLGIGNGEMEETIRCHIAQYRLGESVRLLGRRKDINKLYMGFDVFIMPSLWEGFPVAAVEAIASGLPVLLSDHITKELEICKNVQYLPLNNDKLWIQAFTDIEKNKQIDRCAGITVINEMGLDIHETVHKLEKIYLGYGK